MTKRKKLLGGTDSRLDLSWGDGVALYVEGYPNVFPHGPTNDYLFWLLAFSFSLGAKKAADCLLHCTLGLFYYEQGSVAQALTWLWPPPPENFQVGDVAAGGGGGLP